MNKIDVKKTNPAFINVGNFACSAVDELGRKRNMVSINCIILKEKKQEQTGNHEYGGETHCLIRSRVLNVFLELISSISSFHSTFWSEKTSLSTHDGSREPPCDEPLGGETAASALTLIGVFSWLLVELLSSSLSESRPSAFAFFSACNFEKGHIYIDCGKKKVK
jgi:hypothetical protein